MIQFIAVEYRDDVAVLARLRFREISTRASQIVHHAKIICRSRPVKQSTSGIAKITTAFISLKLQPIFGSLIQSIVSSRRLPYFPSAVSLFHRPSNRAESVTSEIQHNHHQQPQHHSIWHQAQTSSESLEQHDC